MSLLRVPALCLVPLLVVTTVAADDLPEGAVVRLAGGPPFRLTAERATTVAWSADGKLLAAHESGGPVHIWEAATGKRVRTIEVGQYLAMAVAFSPDGKRLATLALTNTAGGCRVWDTATGKQLTFFDIGTTRWGSLTWSPDGKLLALAGSSSQAVGVALIDPDTGKEARRFIPHGSTVHAIAFSPDGNLAASAGRDGVRLWDPATLKHHADTQNSPLAKSSAEALAFAPDGKTLVTLSGGKLVLWDVAKGEKGKEVSVSAAAADDRVAFSLDGKYLAVGSDEVSVVGMGDGKLIQKLSASLSLGGTTAERFIVPFVFSPDGKRLATCSGTQLRVWEVASGKDLFPAVGHTEAVLAMRFFPDGKRLASVSADGSVVAWDAATGKEVAREKITPSNVLPHFAAAPDNKTVVISDRQVMKRWQVGGATQERTAGADKVWNALSPDGRLGAVVAPPAATEPGRRKVELHDLETGKVVQTITVETVTPIPLPRFTPDGRTLVLFTTADGLHLHDVADGKLLHKLTRATTGGRVSALPFSPDGRLALLVESGALEVMEVMTGKVRVRLNAASTAAAFSPDGRLVAVSLLEQGGQRSTRFFDLATGKERARLKFGTGPLQFSSDGKLLAVQESPGTILLADVSRLVPASPAAAKLTAEQLKSLWDDLGGEDAERAHAAVWALAGAPGQAEEMLAGRLKEKGTKAERIAKLIKDLDADEFDARENASKELLTLGAEAAAALRKALQEKPSAELRRRAEEILERLDAGGAPLESVVRPVRAIEALERLGTAEAKKLLEELAKSGGAEVVREAKASLARLAQR